MTKKLIVNADDLGRSPGINRGIVDAHRKGIVTSTTVMINLPDAPDALELAANQAPNLGIGLHLNLTYGQPVTPVSAVKTLVDDDGQFVGPDQWHDRFDRIDPEHLERELTAQFDRFVNLTGRVPDHLDAHHHIVYLHPAALKTSLTLAAKHRLPMRDGRINDPDETALVHLKQLVGGMSDEQARQLLAALRAALADSPAPCWPAYLEAGFFAERAVLGNLLVILTNLPADRVTELMCHPGYADAALANSSYSGQREAEIEHLTHAATRECVQAENIQLITFADVVC